MKKKSKRNYGALMFFGLIFLQLVFAFVVWGVERDTGFTNCYDKFSNVIVGLTCEDSSLKNPVLFVVCAFGMVVCLVFIIEFLFGDVV
jgi:hypothetical protein